MDQAHRRFRRTAAAAALALCGVAAQAATLGFSKLAGVTGGGIASTAVYKADLSTLGSGSFQSLVISDVSGGFGGSPGRFSGFDLDAVVISSTDCATAACAKTAANLGLVNYGSTVLAAGSQRAPVDPGSLFGTSGGTSVDNAVATLGSFDGEATTAIPGAFGFVSLGDFGSLGLNLTGPTQTAGLYLYIGEVGDNGEVAGSNITLQTMPLVPEPGTWALLVAGLAATATAGLQRRRRAGRPLTRSTPARPAAGTACRPA